MSSRTPYCGRRGAQATRRLICTQHTPPQQLSRCCSEENSTHRAEGDGPEAHQQVEEESINIMARSITSRTVMSPTMDATKKLFNDQRTRKRRCPTSWKEDGRNPRSWRLRTPYRKNLYIVENHRRERACQVPQHLGHRSLRTTSLGACSEPKNSQDKSQHVRLANELRK